MKKKFLITALVGMLLAFNVCAVSARNMDFDDLPKSHWAYETFEFSKFLVFRLDVEKP